MLIKFKNGTEKEYADLRYADLSDADLRYADLRYADLSGAHLRYADLSGAHLSGAHLSGADLRDANLRGAHLSGADLPEGYRIARLDFGGWSVCVTPAVTTIGCQSHPNDLWLAATPEWIDGMDERATAWWTRHGATVQAAIRDVMSPVNQTTVAQE